MVGNIQFVEIDEKDVDKASYTWSGFLYQGKVAIYTTLKYINHFYPNLDEIRRYQLEIEYLEDFSIIKDGQHISLHQVKAKPNTNTIGSYNEANLNLLGKLVSYPSVQEVNLHTAVAIKEFTKENLFEKLSGFDVVNKKKELTTYKTLIFEEGKFEDLFSKLKISCNDGIVPIERVVEIEKIQELIKNEIDVFYSNCGNESLQVRNATYENKNYMYSNFINLIEEKVHQDHLKKMDEQKIIVDFEYFLHILLNDSVFTFTNRTVSGLLLHMISDDFNQYCSDYGITDDDTNSYDIWESHIQNLKKFHPNEFFSLCLKLTPHLLLENKDSLGIDEFRKIMQPNGVSDSFIHGLISLASKISEPLDAQSAYVIQEGGNRYILSTINSRGPCAHETIGEQIYKNLSQNDSMFQMLFEVNAYINSSITNVFTGNITRINSDKSSEVNMGEDMKQTITDQKTIKFLGIEKVKGMLL